MLPIQQIYYCHIQYQNKRLKVRKGGWTKGPTAHAMHALYRYY